MTTQCTGVVYLQSAQSNYKKLRIYYIINCLFFQTGQRIMLNEKKPLRFARFGQLFRSK